MHKLLKKYSNIKFYILFIFVIFFTQFSSIDREVIDWDESTFFVISKYISNGEILYVDFWDGKPPMLFLYLAINFTLFGQTLLVGRLAGDFIIFLTVLIVFKILENEFNKVLSMSSSLFLIYLYSHEASQPTMTEHLGILFVTLSIYVVIKNNQNINFYFLGVLFSLSFNTRNNLAFASLGIFIYLIIEKKITLSKIIKIVLGFITPIALFSIYFLVKSSFANYFYMLIEFPLQISTYRMNFSQLKNSIYNKLNLEEFISIELVIVLILFCTFLYSFKKFNYSDTPNLLKLNIFVAFFITLSLVAGGKLYNHYLIQLFPFVAMIFCYSCKLFLKKRSAIFVLLIFTISLNSNLFFKGINNFLQYENISRNYPIKSISKSLSMIILEEETFLALENHLIYLYTDKIMSNKVVHPSNLPNTQRYKTILESLTELEVTTDNEFENIIKNIPDYIFCEKECTLHIPNNYFQKNFDLILEKEDLKLYKKKSL